VPAFELAQPLTPVRQIPLASAGLAATYFSAAASGSVWSPKMVNPPVSGATVRFGAS
jgi:hypothetical protein